MQTKISQEWFVFSNVAGSRYLRSIVDEMSQDQSTVDIVVFHRAYGTVDEVCWHGRSWMWGEFYEM
jgi:hypothetical protein